MNARKVAGTSPSGRIMPAKQRMAKMTRAGPRILYFSIGGPGKDPTDRDHGAKGCQDETKEPRRSTRTEGETALSGQFGRSDQRKVVSFTSASPP